MKLSKSFMKKMLILILSVFVLVPVILMVFGLDKPKYEGFFNMDDDGYGSSATTPSDKIIAINAPLIGSATGEISNNLYTGVDDGDKLYCVLGNITCEGGYTASMETTDSDGIKVYNCVSGGTVDNTMAKCNGSIFSGSTPFNSTNTNAVNFHRYGSNGCQERNKRSVQFNSFENEYGSNSTLGISGDLSDFTSAYNSVPLKFTSDSSYDYVVFQDVFQRGFYSDISFSDISFSTCDMFDTLINCEQNYANCPTSGSSGDDDDDADDSSSGNKLSTKCLGDFGDGVGDKLCCGQTGVIQNEHSKYTCPESHPYCRGYKCGESWGACYSIEDED